MAVETVFVLLVAACAVAAAVDPRVRGGGAVRLVAGPLAAALIPVLIGAAVLTLTDPAAPTERLVWDGLATSVGVGLLVGVAAVVVRAARAVHRGRSSAA